MTDINFTLDTRLKPAPGEKKLTAAQAAQVLTTALQAQREGTAGVSANIMGDLGIPTPAAAISRNYTSLINKMVKLLPDSALYETTLHQIDPAQVLSFIATARGAEPTINGVKFRSDEHYAATELLKEQDTAQAAAIRALNNNDPAAAEQAIRDYQAQRSKNTVLGASPMSVFLTAPPKPTLIPTATAANTPPVTTIPLAKPGVSPTATPLNAAPSTSSTSSTDYTAALDSLGSLGGQALLTRADVHNLFALGGNDLGALSTVSDWETSNPAKLAPGASTMQVQDPTWSELFGAMGRVGKPRTGFLGATAGGYNLPPGALGPGPGDRIASRPYTVTELINLLHTKSRDEITALQQKLKQAGYYLATGKASGPDYVGDPNDAATADAWRRLITDSARSGTSLMTTLATRAQAARASGVVDAAGNALNEWGQTTDKFGHAVDAQGRLINPEGGLINKLGQLINDKGELIDKFGNVLNADGTAKPDIHLTDSATVRLQADQLGQSTLGRKLKPEEHAALVSFIHSLESGAQTAFAAPGSQTGENVDVASRIEEYLRREHPTEAGGKDVANQYDAFRSLLAGPGR